MKESAKIYVAGHCGLVGSAIKRRLESAGYGNLVVRTSAELDLRDPEGVMRFFEVEHPDYVFLAAAKVGGILANDTLPADFIYDNIMIQANIIHCSHLFGVKKLLFLGSSCIYPRMARQPIREEELLSGHLEPTNEPYAVAKIAGIKMCQSYRRQHGANFICAMPTNLYGPGDAFDLETSHVVPALIRKFHEAKIENSAVVEVWGSGRPRREFLYVDDLADACLFLMQEYDSGDIINVGAGTDIRISELAELIRKITEFGGRLVFDSSKPDGTPRKLLDVRKLSALGWQAQTPLEKGLACTYRWFRTNMA